MINRIHVKGFKSIKDQSVELRRLNVLIGSNGIGKTNFVSVFDLLKAIYQGSLREYVLKNNGANKLLYNGAKITSEITLDVEVEDEHEKRLYENKLSFVQDTLAVDYSHLSICQQCDYQTLSFVNGLSEPHLREWKCDFECIRTFHFHDTTLTSKMKMFQDVNDNRSLKSDGSNIAPYLYYLEKRHPNQFYRIESMIRSVSPFFDGFSLMPDRLNPGVISLEWKQKGCEDVFNAYQLSDGTLRFICLATLLMQPELPPVIIIDEPEIGLHPQAINKLASVIKKAAQKTQIIICTQSNYLVDNFDPEDVMVVDRKDNATVLNRLDSEKLSSWLGEYSLGEIWEMNVIGGQPS